MGLGYGRIERKQQKNSCSDAGADAHCDSRPVSGDTFRSGPFIKLHLIPALQPLLQDIT